MSEGLFVYGTLRPDCAPREIRDVVERLRPLGEGTLVGTVHDLGDYPGLVLQGRRRVPGLIFALPEDPQALRALDAYEEFLPGDPEKSLFVRKKRMVTMADGRRKQHWVYVYNGELPVAS